MSQLKSLNRVSLYKQRGVNTAVIIVALAVGALLFIGGTRAYKYIEEQKMNNDMGELTDIRGSMIRYASKHNSSFATLTLAIGCAQNIFPASSCSGTGAGTTVANSWGGQYAVSATNVSGGTNNGGRLTSSALSDAACISEVTNMWDQFAKIEVGTTTVKATITAPIDDAGVNAACTGNNNTIAWTVKA